MLVEAVALIGLDHTSSIALDNLKKASEELIRKHGIRLLIIPFNTWSNDVEAVIKSLPTVIIGGIKAFSGYAPSVEEIVDFVIKYVKRSTGKKELREALIPAAIFGHETLADAATV